MMNGGMIIWIIGIVVGISLAYLANKWESELKKRNKEWIIPLSIVGGLTLMCLSFFLFPKFIESVNNTFPSLFYGLLAAIATFSVLRQISHIFRRGGLFGPRPNESDGNKTEDK